MRAPLAVESWAQPAARTLLIAAVVAAVALMAAAAALHSTLAAGIAGGGFLAGGLLTLGDRRLPALFLGALAGLLVGYAFLGRGLAHVGIPPLYVGEMVLGLACLTIIVRLGSLKLGTIEWLLVAFIALGTVRTLPYIRPYGTDALRDAVLWGYAVFAIAIPLAMQGRGQLDSLLAQYGRGLPAFLLWVPIVGLLVQVAPGLVPNGPGSDVSLVFYKGADMAVHLSAAAAFISLGLYAQVAGGRVYSWLLWGLWLVSLTVVSTSRGAFITALLGVAVVGALRPSTRLLQLGVIAGLGLSIAALLSLEFRLSDASDRSISVEHMVDRVESIFSDSGEDNGLQGTREYRLEWWNEIVSYTVTGPYFWTGKGFGVNLADDDGYQINADHSLRAPHNSHMTVLARMGVPGLLLWTALQLGFAGALFRAWRRASKAQSSTWAAVNLWLLIYWLAIVVNTSFDPYLEGPQGGIWFWSVLGAGLYVVRAQAADIEAAEQSSRVHGIRPGRAVGPVRARPQANAGHLTRGNE